MPDANSKPNYAHFEHLTAFLLQSTSFELADVRLAENRHYYIHLVRVSESYHRVGIPDQFPIIYPNVAATDKSPSLSDVLEEIFALLDGLVEGGKRLGVLVPIVIPAIEVRMLLRQRGWQNDFVVFNKDDFHEIGLHGFDKFQKIVSTQLNLKVLNPYTSLGPVTEEMFFGREKETMYTAERLSKHSFVYVGGRRIGKTSFLHHLRIELNKLNKFSPLYINCEAFVSSQGFYHRVRDFIVDYWVSPTAISQKIFINEEAIFSAPNIVDTQNRLDELSNARYQELKNREIADHEKFSQFIMEISTFLQGRQLVLLLDEVDRLAREQPEMFVALRQLHTEGILRCVFCGERGLENASDDANHSLFNFCKVQNPFGFFSPAEAHELIARPFDQLRISFKSGSKIVETIMENTARRPNLVQELCRRLVDDLADRLGDEQPVEKRMITVADVERVVSAQAQKPYSEFYVESVWGKCSLLAKAISIIFEPEHRVEIKDVVERLRKKDFRVTRSQCDDALRWLCLYNLAVRDGRQFHFVHHGFRKILELHISAEEMLNYLREEIEEEISHGTV